MSVTFTAPDRMRVVFGGVGRGQVQQHIHDIVYDREYQVGALQWDVTPAILDGRGEDDFGRVFTLAFDNPDPALKAYHFDVRIAGVEIQGRASWGPPSSPLTIGVDATVAKSIADTMPTDHVEVELRFFADAVETQPFATSSRRVLIFAEVGDVTKAEFTAEQDRRTKGDDPQAVVVTTAEQLATELAAQATSDQPLFISFRNREPFTASGTTYNHGDLIYYPPRSTSPERIGNVASRDDVDAGDTWQALSAGSAAALATQLRQHADRSLSSNAALIHITENFTTGTRSYVKDQRWYAAPHFGTEAFMVLVHDPSAGTGLTPEQAAKLNALPVYAAQMAVWPPNVRKHSDFQRNFQSTLAGLDPALAADGGATGTRFVNNFQILTRLSDGTVVPLHTQGWAFTSDDRQTIPWAVSAAEFNTVGASAATNGIEVWGEFRAIYGGGVDELRGRTSPFFIDFGEEGDWPATRDDLKTLQPTLTAAQQIALLALIPDPGSITYTNADDLMPKVKTIRINIPNPELLTGDVWVQGWTQGQPATGARMKWASTFPGLNIVLADANADAVASALVSNADEQVEVRLRFYDAATAGNEIERVGVNIPLVKLPTGTTDVPDVPANAATAKRYELGVPATSGPAVWQEAQASEDAAAAKTLAEANESRIGVLEELRFGARLRIFPQTFASAASLRGTHTAVLEGLQEDLLFNNPAARTPPAPVARFRILVGATVVHDQAWTWANRDQEIQFEISAAELTSIGADSTTDYVAFHGEFRPAANDENLALTSPFIAAIGDRNEFPTTRGEAAQAVNNASDIGYATIADGAALSTFLTEQASSPKPRLVLFTAAISGHVHSGITYNFVQRQVTYFKPATVNGVNFFVLPGGGDTGQSESQVKDAISSALASTLPPFADIRLLPESVPGSQVPDDIYVELAGKLTSREIDGLTLVIQGVTIQPHASTPVSGFDTETQALVRFDVSTVADAIANGLSASDRTAIVDLTFSFTEGDDFTRRILLPVNNPNAPRLVQGELDSITFNAALTLDWLAPDMRTVTLTDDVTFAFSNIQIGRPLVVETVQGAPGNHGITWPSSVEWADKTKQGPTAAAGARDIFSLLPLSATRVLASAFLNSGPPA